MKLLKILSSLKLTVVLLPLLAVEMVLFSTFSGGRRFFSSPLFLLPLLLFLLNLMACTFRRITKWRSWRNWRKAGPDLIHIGLIGLIVLGLLTPGIREEASFKIVAGEQLELRAGTVLEVRALDFSTYQDGRPSSWQAELLLDDKPEVLKVNHPVKVGGIRLFLTGFGTRPELVYRESGEMGEGVKMVDLSEGLFLRGEEWRLKELRLEGPENWMILLESQGESLRLSTSESREGFEILKLQLHNEAVLLLVYNPLVPFLFWAFGIICLGLVIILLSRMREEWV